MNESEEFTYDEGVKSWRKKYEIMHDKTMERDVAKPLTILSAYLITLAIIKPPNA